MEKGNNGTKKKKTVTNTAKKNSTSKKVTSSKMSSKVNEIKKNPVVKKEQEVQVNKIVTEKIEERNNEKKDIKKVNTKVSSNFGGEEIRKLLIIIGAVCAVMLAFYFITEVVLDKKQSKADNKPENEVKFEPEIQYEKILMGSLLNQNEEDYYVLVYDDEDSMVEVYNDYINQYKETEDPLKVYKVDLGEDFNKSYIADESYLTGDDISKVRVTETTLIRVSKKRVYKSFVGQEEIIGRFKYMLG